MPKRILYACPYIPAEWIAAWGWEPCHIRPQGQCSACLEGLDGVCAFVSAFLSDLLKDEQADAVIITTLCDQMRRAFDLYTSLDQRPAFLFNVPSTWQTAQARRLYSDEVKRLGRFLHRLGGTPPNPTVLARIMRSDDDQRAQLRTAPAHSGQAAQLRLALVGGPLLQRDNRLQDILAQCGADILLDATETGLLGTCRAFDPQALQDDPFTELIDAYFDSIQHVGRRPNTGFYQCLREAVGTHAIQGIIWRRYLWCDLWHAELARFKEEIKLPVLDLEVTDALPKDRTRLLNRVQAFIEMLQ